MKRRNKVCKSRGVTFIELLIASLISLVVGAGLMAMLQSTYTARSNVMGQNIALSDTRRTLALLSDNIRNAQMVSGTGAFSAASSNAVTCYTASTGATTTKYWLDTTSSPGTLKQTDATGTKVLLTDVQSLQFTYYTSSASNFTSAAGQWAATASPSAPTAAEIQNLGAIQIAVTINANGFTRTLKTMVRLRNSPVKPHI